MPILRRDVANRDVVNVDFVAFDQVQEQVQRAFKHFEFYFIFLHRLWVAGGEGKGGCVSGKRGFSFRARI
jgi:hypothetical protein